MEPEFSIAGKLIDIELTNLCQANCLMCPRAAVESRPKGIMSEETFQNIVKKIKKSDIETISFSGHGEPLINKNIFNYIKLLKSELPFIDTVLVTNGALLTQDTVKKLLELKLDAITISFQSISSSLYSTLMPGLEYDQVMKNIKFLIATAPKWLRINISVTVHKMNKSELNKFLFYWKQYDNVEVIVLQLHSRGGALTDERIIDQVDNPIMLRGCKIFDNITFIAWTGQVFSCSHDVKGENLIGDINYNTFEEILNNKRKIIETQKWFPICLKCNDSLR